MDIVVTFAAHCSDFAGVSVLKYLLGMLEASVSLTGTLFTSQVSLAETRAAVLCPAYCSCAYQSQ